MKLALSLVLLTGCASTADVDMSRAQPACARQCSAEFSQCLSVPLPSIATQMMMQAQCKQGLEFCVRNCPPK